MPSLRAFASLPRCATRPCGNMATRCSSAATRRLSRRRSRHHCEAVPNGVNWIPRIVLTGGVYVDPLLFAGCVLGDSAYNARRDTRTLPTQINQLGEGLTQDRRLFEDQSSWKG